MDCEVTKVYPISYHFCHYCNKSDDKYNPLISHHFVEEWSILLKWIPEVIPTLTTAKICYSCIIKFYPSVTELYLNRDRKKYPVSVINESMLWEYLIDMKDQKEVERKRKRRTRSPSAELLLDRRTFHGDLMEIIP